MQHIRRKILFTLLAAILALGGYAAFAPGDATAAQDEAEDTPMMVEMKVVDECLRKLRRSLRKKEGEMEESLKLIDEAQMANVKCKAYLPKMTESIPESERPAFLKEYRVRMVEVMQRFCDMELAVLNGEWDKAEELYEKLRELEEKGHEKFIPEGERP